MRFVVLATVLDGQASLHALDVVLPVHYWQRWTHLLDGTSAGLGLGLAIQAATVLVALTAAVTILSRRDPAA